MNYDQQRLKDAEALNLVTNRVFMDYLSLQVDRGLMDLEAVKRLISFSANEVIRGSSGYEHEVRFFEKVLIDRFDETFPS